jgi:hypothetical protein
MVFVLEVEDEQGGKRNTRDRSNVCSVKRVMSNNWSLGFGFLSFFLSWFLVRRQREREGQRDRHRERERATQTEREGMRMVCNMYL